MSEIKIILPPYAERTKLGKLTVINNQKTVFTCQAYGKADGAAAEKADNPKRDPLKKCGDTPFGGYVFVVVKFNPLDDKKLRTYGKGHIIRLEPKNGDAQKARLNGRRGLHIHGGALNVHGKLRPTNGCVRVSNEDMAAIIKALNGTISGTCEITQGSLPKSMLPTMSGTDEILVYLDGATGGVDEMIEYPEEEVDSVD